MRKLTGLLKWIDNNLVKFLVWGFIFIVPLYPKFPLKLIDYTYIAIRMEDLYVTVLAVIFFIQVLRRKITINKRFFKLFIIYWILITASFVFNAFVTGTVIYKHLGFLHTLRRLEYMIPFFIAISVIKSKKDFYTSLYLTFIAIFLVIGYGFGQKFFGWPAVQTMNDVFAKGMLLRLTPEARVSSTFAGHYDLAAYLIFFIPLILAFFLYKGKKLYFAFFSILFLMLTLTASRTSYIAYGVSVLAFLIFVKKPKLLLAVAILTIGITYASKSLTTRFFKAFQIRQIFVNQKTGQVVVPERLSSKELPAGTFYVTVNDDSAFARKAEENAGKNEVLLQQRIIDDLRDEARKSGKTLTATDEARIAASMSAGLKPVNTVVSDISMATRFQVEWPRAIKAFLKNPLLGTGPSSITEATDNDYLRSLGEFGLLGTVAFGFIIFSIVKFIYARTLKIAGNEKYVYLGLLFGIGALLINASYIDVFEASKVAYVFWLTLGFFVGSLDLQK